MPTDFKKHRISYNKNDGIVLVYGDLTRALKLLRRTSSATLQTHKRKQGFVPRGERHKLKSALARKQARRSAERRMAALDRELSPSERAA